MKDVEVRKIKKITGNVQKLFTKKKISNTINKNYNPLKVNYEIYKRGSGLYMENIALNQVKKELSEKYNIKEKVIEILFEKCKELNYNINESKEIIMKFFKYKQLVQNLSIDLEKNSNI